MRLVEIPGPRVKGCLSQTIPLEDGHDLALGASMSDCTSAARKRTLVSTLTDGRAPLARRRSTERRLMDKSRATSARVSSWSVMIGISNPQLPNRGGQRARRPAHY